MLKIESSDTTFLTVSRNQSYGIDGNPELQVRIDVSPNFRHEWNKIREIIYEWEKHKQFVDSNPAIKASWESFMTMSHLAKEIA